jgi:Brp/Blh family beta-carotene 15,15'-monooxygenase
MTDAMRRPALLLASSGCVLLAMLALRALEAQWPPLALWAFVLLSLTLGFGHGALDAVLLLGQFAPRSKALVVSALYLLSVLLAGWALSWSVPWALLLLVLMSVWHFGELHSYALWARLCVGGASVMWPMLVAQGAMAELLQGTLGAGFSAAWQAWHMLANGWLILVLFCTMGWVVRWFLSRTKLSGIGESNASGQGLLSSRHHHALFAALEILAIWCAYLLLSPLLAFALYFGVYHCLTHVARVRRAVLAHSGLALARYAAAFIASALATALLLALLWRFMPNLPWLGVGNAFSNPGQILQWLVVSLAAVTLPHLILVSYSARWLNPAITCDNVGRSHPIPP